MAQLRGTPIGADQARQALASAYRRITDTVTGLAEVDFLRFSGCRGWTVADLLLHELCDAQRALVALASPADEPSDVDFVSYWTPFKPSEGTDLPHTRYIRAWSAAYSGPLMIVEQWTATAGAAVRAATAAPADGRIRTQGHVLDVPDFLVTLATEAAIHHLDLTVDLPEAPRVPDDAAAVAVLTLNGLLGRAGHAPPPDRAVDSDTVAAPAADPPAGWSPEEYLRKGTGRAPLTDADRAALGPAAASFPLLG